MTTNESARPAEATTERATTKSTGKRASFWDYCTTQKAGSQLSISDFLGCGESEARTLSYLKTALSLDGRTIRRLIERERRSGVPIISNPGGRISRVFFGKYKSRGVQVLSGGMSASFRDQENRLVRPARGLPIFQRVIIVQRDDFFREARERVSARSAAECYGFHPNRAGFICCPFHSEKTPSLKLYDNGSFHCFGCGAGGSSIDFTMKLFGLDALEAVRRLNEDFRLGLELDKPLTREERETAQQAAQKRQALRDTWELFENWRLDTMNQLNAVFRLAHLALKKNGPLTDGEVVAIAWQAWAEYLSDILATGTMEEKMWIFRDGEEVSEKCATILCRNSWLPAWMPRQS